MDEDRYSQTCRNSSFGESCSIARANRNFSGWTKTFTDPRLCAAIVDRLTFGGNIIETGTDSYRLAQTRARAGHAAS
jgi:DNA replication protein DnaC